MADVVGFRKLKNTGTWRDQYAVTLYGNQEGVMPPVGQQMTGAEMLEVPETEIPYSEDPGDTPRGVEWVPVTAKRKARP